MAIVSVHNTDIDNKQGNNAVCQCDQCGAYASPARNVSSAAELAKSDGWKLAKTSLRPGVPLIWLCPECQGS